MTLFCGVAACPQARISARQAGIHTAAGAATRCHREDPRREERPIDLQGRGLRAGGFQLVDVGKQAAGAIDNMSDEAKCKPDDVVVAKGVAAGTSPRT